MSGPTNECVSLRNVPPSAIRSTFGASALPIRFITGSELVRTVAATPASMIAWAT